MTTLKTASIMKKPYQSPLSILETEIAIKQVKDYFERGLSEALNLTRVSAPLFVRPETGLNDNLNGVERAVSFDVKGIGANAEIVHSLAKWKRMALHRYGFKPCEGLYTDMNAIRRDEDLDQLHSIYVDQWDWEKIILKEDRHEAKLRDIVERIYKVFKKTESHVHALYPMLEQQLPEEIYFITSEELLALYPQATPKERENLITKDKGAVFLMQIGDTLSHGQPHDGRAPDYDDWSLNGDILFWNPILETAFELSSMGIRVDEDALASQLEKAKCTDRMSYSFHQMVAQRELPYTVGGGIGQSRICMYFLQKAHIGEVQASVWPEAMHEACLKENIFLL